MNLELSRVAPLRAANLIGALYFVMGVAVALLFVPFAVFAQELPDPEAAAERQEFMKRMFGIAMLVYPFLGAAMGWCMGLFGAAVYDLLAPRLGGFRFTLKDLGSQSVESAAY